MNWNTYYHADFRDVAKEVPAQSVDLLFADPLFYPSFVWQYKAVAEIASRVLRPGGSVVFELGIKYMDRIMKDLMGHGLFFHWVLMAAYQSHGPRAIIRDRGIQAGYTPYLWFTKPLENGRRLQLHGKAPDVIRANYEKGLYKYQDSVAEINGIFTAVGLKKGQYVLDLFGGSATVPVVAHAWGLNWISCDLSQEAADLARSRLAPLGREVQTLGQAVPVGIPQGSLVR